MDIDCDVHQVLDSAGSRGVFNFSQESHRYAHLFADDLDGLMASMMVGRLLSLPIWMECQV